jgi:SAM-dependent methyltransferase
MNVEFYEAWKGSTHARVFDAWSKLPLRQLRKIYESFNEVRLFIENQVNIQLNDLIEIGCATGEFFRYITHFCKRFSYIGFDISETAVRRAKEKYPEGKFYVCREDLTDIDGFYVVPPAILFARDVVLHQTDPFGFLAKLLTIPNEAVVLRIRTRDKGMTILDPEISCQWNYNKWVPYMILNLDEVITLIKSTVNFQKLQIYKNHQPLGGQSNRYLPKDCFYPETGTAETALYIQLSKSEVKQPEITIVENSDSKPAYSFWERQYYRICAKISLE